MSTVYVVGIDFGTSNSCVTFATYEEDLSDKLDPKPVSPPEPIPFDDRETIPTVVFVGDGDAEGSLFGERAEEKALFYPESTHAGFKMRLGLPGETGRLAFERAREFLTFLRARVGEFVPLDEPEGSHRVETIIGHPVQWSADQREETRRAAEEAGFPSVQLEDESLAALYLHLCEEGSAFQPQLGSRLLMIDMGGGTTDFAFLQIPTSAEARPVSRPVDPAPVVAAWRPGCSSYGGRDLDELLLEHLSRDWEPEWTERYRGTLMREVRRFKEAFSDGVRHGRHRSESTWLVGDVVREVTFSREEFERVAADYIEHFEALVRAALALGNVTPNQVSTIILAGGHSRWYFVDYALRGVFPHLLAEKGTLLRHDRPEQSVARGLGFAPMVRAAGAKILAPVRKSAHSIWVHVPYGARVAKNSSAENWSGRGSSERATGWDDPVLILARGHALPYLMPKPLQIAVNKLGLDAKEATVRVQFYSSAGGTTRQALYERVARFERSRWEGLLKRLAAKVPWAKGMDEDQFELLITCHVGESELLTAELVIVRYFRGRQVDVQRQKLQANTGTIVLEEKERRDGGALLVGAGA